MPRTEAGKRLLGLLRPVRGFDLRGAIDAIEAEARDKAISDVIDRAESDIRAAERARIRAAVEARLRIVDNPGSIDSLRAVLRIIDGVPDERP